MVNPVREGRVLLGTGEDLHEVAALQSGLGQVPVQLDLVADPDVVAEWLEEAFRAA